MEQKVPNVFVFQRLKCDVLLLLSVFVIVNEISLRFGTWAGQKKQNEDVDTVSRKV